jgi:hypothetical protein
MRNEEQWWIGRKGEEERWKGSKGKIRRGVWRRKKSKIDIEGRDEKKGKTGEEVYGWIRSRLNSSSPCSMNRERKSNVKFREKRKEEGKKGERQKWRGKMGWKERRKMKWGSIANEWGIMNQQRCVSFLENGGAWQILLQTMMVL